MKAADFRLAAGVPAVLVVHLVFGWAWTILAAVGVGYWHGRRGWLAGAICVGVSFVLLILYNFVVAPGPTVRMGTVMGGILQNVPAWAVFALTGLIGVLIGTAGGGLGSGLRRIMR